MYIAELKPAANLKHSYKTGEDFDLAGTWTAEFKSTDNLKHSCKTGEAFDLAGTWTADLKLLSQFHTHAHSFILLEASEPPI